jgi:hypothetical protein
MESLKPKLTTEFLATLTEAARRYGWSGDYIEIKWFVESVCALAGQHTPPYLHPYQCNNHDPWF